MQKVKTIFSFRRDKRKEIEPMVEEFKEVEKELSEYQTKLRKQVLEFVDSPYIPYKIASELVEKNLPQLDALALIHKAIYKLNDILTKNAVYIMPEVNKLYNDAKITLSTTQQELLVDETLYHLTNSNAEREREVNYITLPLSNQFKRIERVYNSIKELVKFLDKQNDYLMRLESSIRLKQKILDSSAINEIMASGQNIIQMEL